MIRSVYAALRFTDGRLEVLDQTALPEREVWLELDSARAAAEAIRRLAVRGAPMIGITAAYALALTAPAEFAAAAAELRAARPTAVNLAWAVDRVLAAGPERALAEAHAIHDEQEAANAAIGGH